MPRPWKLLESVQTPEGQLDLRRRGDRDYAILIDGRMLMNSSLHRTEFAVAELGCAPIAGRAAPRVLIGGLGLGFTLRAVLDAMPPSAEVVVAELNPVVVEWCRGPIGSLTDDALDDPRVEVVVGDVMDEIHEAADGPAKARFDAVILDLYLGPDDAVHGQLDPIFGTLALTAMKAALTPGGVLAVWGEEPNRGYLRRMRDAGFDATLTHTLPPGPRHAVYVGLEGARSTRPGRRSARR
jgi:spermidine synthase